MADSSFEIDIVSNTVDSTGATVVSAVISNQTESSTVDSVITAGGVGPIGATGATGPKGDTGATGATGPAGGVTSVNSQTGAVNLTQDNVADGTTYKQYSATDKSKVALTSGTNTGDETLSTIKSKLGVTTLSGSNTGDQSIPTSLPPNGSAGGDLTGTYPSPTLGAVTTGATVGSASAIPVITYDAKGRITSTTTAAISGGGGGTVTSVSSADANATVATGTTTPVITIAAAPKLSTARTINGVSFDGTASITVADSTKVAKTGDTVSGSLDITRALGTNTTTQSFVTGDTLARVATYAAGTIAWGSGSAAVDTNLYRNASAVLKTDGGLIVGTPGTTTGSVATIDGTQTLTNKTFDTAGTGNVFKIGGTAVTAVTGTGSNVLATSPTITTPTLSGTVAGTYTLGGTPTFPSTVVLTTGAQTLASKTLTTPVISSISNTGTLTLPTSTDTLVGRATTDTLTNKTIAGGSNTISGITQSMLTVTQSTQTNTGSAGGTMTYVNLGGIKILTAISAALSVASGGSTFVFTLPSSFFTTITSAVPSLNNIGSTANQSTSTLGTTTSSITVQCYSSVTTIGTETLSLIVFGT